VSRARVRAPSDRAIAPVGPADGTRPRRPRSGGGDEATGGGPRADSGHRFADVSVMPPAGSRASPTVHGPEGGEPIQRLVAVGNRAFAPRSIRNERKFEQDPSVSRATYVTSLQVIVPQAQTFEGGDEFGVLIGAIRDSAGEGAVETLWSQYRDVNRAYLYTSATDYNFKHATPTGENALMDPKDMGDKTATVPQQYVESAACVIQSLADLGIAVPDSDVESTARRWHTYCVSKGLDYRTDSDYLKLYVNMLNLTLVHSRLVAWTAVPWDELGGDGDYLVATYGTAPGPTSIGHMVGVRVAEGAPTVYDHQDLTKPTLDGGGGYARYVFRR